MTTWTLQAPLAPLTLNGGSQIVFEAVSPSTGNAVGTVTVTNVTVYGFDESVSIALFPDGVPAYALEGDDSA